MSADELEMLRGRAEAELREPERCTTSTICSAGPTTPGVRVAGSATGYGHPVEDADLHELTRRF